PNETLFEDIKEIVDDKEVKNDVSLQEKEPVQIKESIPEKNLEKKQIVVKTKVGKDDVIAEKEQTNKEVKADDSIYINVGSYLLKDNITKLERAGKKNGFDIKVNTLFRKIQNYALFLGNLPNKERMNIVSKDLNKRSIEPQLNKKKNGSYDVYTKLTPLKFLAERQKRELVAAGYKVKLIKKKEKTPLNHIFVGPLQKDQVENVKALLKKMGFPTTLVKP
ncbi:MAG: hypothetical protein HQK84_11630, partial [Nitrospinae bacterium]|nr:hypothetical protein [Nitrospinota bacterium]